MSAPEALAYAPSRRRWSRRRKVRLSALVTLVVAGSLCGYSACRDVRRRMAILDGDARLGPVDWPAVFGSPALMRLAWQLSSSTDTRESFCRGECAAAGYRMLCEDYPGVQVVVDEVTLHESDGENTRQMDVRVTLENRRSEVLLLPTNRQARWARFGGGETVLYLQCQHSGALGVVRATLKPGEQVTILLTSRVPSVAARLAVAQSERDGPPVPASYWLERPDFAPDRPLARSDSVPDSVARIWPENVQLKLVPPRSYPRRFVWLSWPDAMLTPDERPEERDRQKP